MILEDEDVGWAVGFGMVNKGTVGVDVTGGGTVVGANVSPGGIACPGGGVCWPVTTQR